jgi:BioD-like phosphotransacetylase family protein
MGGDSYLGVVNNELVKTLNAQVILVASAAGKTIDQLDDQIEYAANTFGGLENILGAIINRYPVEKSQIVKDLIGQVRSENRLFYRQQLELIGVVPDSHELTYCRTIDIQRHLNAEVVNAGEMASRRVKKTHLLARTVPNLLHALSGSHSSNSGRPQRHHSRCRDGGAEPDSGRRTHPDWRHRTGRTHYSILPAGSGNGSSALAGKDQ